MRNLQTNMGNNNYNMPLGNPMWTKSSVNWPLATTVTKWMQPRKKIKISRTSVVHFSLSQSKKKNVIDMHNWVRGLTVYVVFYCLKSSSTRSWCLLLNKACYSVQTCLNKKRKTHFYSERFKGPAVWIKYSFFQSFHSIFNIKEK